MRRMGLEAAAAGVGGDSLGQVDGEDGEDDQDRRQHVDHGGLVGAEQVLEDPDRQRLDARPGGERGHDDLVELKANANSPPANSADRISGNVTYRKVCTVVA